MCKKEIDMEKVVLNVGGMSCEHCVKAVKNAVGGLTNAKVVDISLKTGKVTVEYNSSKISLDEIKNAIKEEDYEVE
jgi:copper chaperone